MKSKQFFRLVLVIDLILCFALGGEAKVKLPVLVSDGMILQRELPVTIWGTADQGEAIVVTFQKKKYTATADNAGDWKVTLPAMKAGGPYTMTVNEIEIRDILIGDVWLASGQSNMETPMSRLLDLYADEVAAYSNANIRYVKTPTAQDYHRPQPDIPQTGWKALTPENALGYSGVCYFFAKELYEKIKVPIGIINSSVGGSPIESWISEEGLKDFPHYLHDRDLHRSDEYIAQARALNRERGQLWHTILNREDQGLTGAMRWDHPAYDDSGWEPIDLNDKSWARDGGLINGSFWFRREIELSAGLAGKDAVLRLGCIVDADSVFVNGVFVGTTAYQYPPRVYPVPGNLLKAGKNTIAIRLISNSGMAEFVDDKPYKLIVEDQEIDLRKGWKYRVGVRMPASQGVPSVDQRATGFYNGMIAPLKPFSFKGVLWYQGESNTGRYYEYGELQASLIREWRTLFNQPELPFLLVQLPNFMRNYPGESQWAAFREVQRCAAREIPYTALAVTIDLGEWNDIHPLNKKDVGYRLALQARRLAYGDRKVIADGPAYESARVEGQRIILTFREGTNEYMPVDELKGFTIAGTDGVYKKAQARVENGKIAVWNKEITDPVSVRYAWANNPEGANLRNTSGLPASPFKTD